MDSFSASKYEEESHRKRDSLVEQEIAKFLDRTFYKSKIVSDSKRKKNTENQFDGIDIVVTIPSLKNNELLLDEKSQSSDENIGKPKPTFAFELSYIKRNGIENVGWFIDSSKKTQYYLLIWIPKVEIQTEIRSDRMCADFNEKDLPALYEEEIIELDYCLVERSQVQLFLEYADFSIEKLRMKANEIRKYANNTKEKIKIYENEWFSFVYSGQIPEKPINVVIKKSIIVGLCDIYGSK